MGCWLALAWGQAQSRGGTVVSAGVNALEGAGPPSHLADSRYTLRDWAVSGIHTVGGGLHLIAVIPRVSLLLERRVGRMGSEK